MKRLVSLLPTIILLAHFAATASSARFTFRSADLVSVHMVTARVGWGTTQTDVLHTTDGGRHWEKVTPLGPRDNGFSIGSLALDVIDSRGAWLAAPNVFGPTSPSALILSHTTDAGHSWKRLPTLQLGSFASVSTLQFVDQIHGWLVLLRDVSMMQISFDIYRTRDGGAHWGRILHVNPFAVGRHSPIDSLPGCDCRQSYAFVTSTSGWVSGCYCGLTSKKQFLFHTADGGRTWHPTVIRLPRRYRTSGTLTGAPIFFSSRVHSALAILPSAQFEWETQ